MLWSSEASDFFTTVREQFFSSELFRRIPLMLATDRPAHLIAQCKTPGIDEAAILWRQHWDGLSGAPCGSHLIESTANAAVDHFFEHLWQGSSLPRPRQRVAVSLVACSAHPDEPARDAQELPRPFVDAAMASAPSVPDGTANAREPHSRNNIGLYCQLQPL